MIATKTEGVAIERPVDYRAELVARATSVRFLRIPKRRYVSVDGTARPGEQGFQDAIAALYPVAYTLHFALKKRGVDAPVGALEGLFEPPKTWRWRLMLAVPAEATPAEIKAAIGEVKAKKQPALIDAVRFDEWEEGAVAQIMHVGRYDAEAPTIERLHAAIREHGLKPRGLHHEIYISDPNRTSPDRLKTLIRQPITTR